MPRVSNSHSDPYDFCDKCFPDLETALADFNKPGTNFEDRGNCFCWNNTCRPEYDDTDYKCHACHKPLTETNAGGADLPDADVEAEGEDE